MRRTTWGAAAVAAVLAVSGCSIQTAGGKQGELELHATFDYIQTLVVGHGVQMSDIPIGTITAIDLIKGHKEFKARVTMSIEDGVNIPKGTAARIARTSLLGENYIRLTPPKGTDLATGPFMRSGDEITDATLQPDIEELAGAILPLVKAFGGEELDTLAAEQSETDPLGGDDTDPVKVVKRIRKLIGSYADMGPQLAKILDGTAVVGKEFAANSEEFAAFLDEAEQMVATLNEEEDRMVSTVKSAVKLAKVTNEKVLGPHTRRLSKMLGQLAPIADFMGNRREEWEYLIKFGLWLSDAAPRVFHPVLGVLGYGWLKGFASPAPDSMGNFEGQAPDILNPYPGPWAPPWAGDEDPPGRGTPPPNDEWPGQGEPPPFEDYDPQPSQDSEMGTVGPGTLANLIGPS